MNKNNLKKTLVLALSLLCLIFIEPVFAHENLPNLCATAHVQDYGDLKSEIGSHVMIGTTGQCKRMEAFTITTDNPNIGVSYCGHVENIGWQNAVQNGQVAGTKGQCKRIECFKLNLIGSEANQYDLYYRAHVENYGWLDWAHHGAPAGTSQHAYRCEALEIAIVPQGSTAPGGGSTNTPAIEAYDRQEGNNMYLVNKLRKSAGKAYLTGHPELHDVAEHRVLELGCFSHTRPDGRDCSTLLHDLYPNSQLTYHCENIGCHNQTLTHASHHYFDNWCHNNTGSGGHHSEHAHHHAVSSESANMLGDYKYMAYAEASNIGGPYVSYGIQCFGN